MGRLMEMQSDRTKRSITLRRLLRDRVWGSECAESRSEYRLLVWERLIQISFAEYRQSCPAESERLLSLSRGRLVGFRTQTNGS